MYVKKMPILSSNNWKSYKYLNILVCDHLGSLNCFFNGNINIFCTQMYSIFTAIRYLFCEFVFIFCFKIFENEIDIVRLDVSVENFD